MNMHSHNALNSYVLDIFLIEENFAKKNNKYVRIQMMGKWSFKQLSVEWVYKRSLPESGSIYIFNDK